MHDNPQTAPDAVFALPGHRVIALRGRDAAAFAQAQFMNDVALIEPGQWQWSGWLTPKGRVVALFALLKLSDETIWLLLPDADALAVVAALQRFVFRAKVALEVRTDLQVSGRFIAPARARGADFDGDETSTIELDLSGDGGPRTLLIGAATSLHTDADAAARWHAQDLLHGLPRLPASQVEHWTPQQLSLDRLRGFSVKKGCYPGQEIVARTHFLGQAKRGLALLELDQPVEAGVDVSAGPVALGKVIASGVEGVKALALAVLPLERDASALRIGDCEARERPLLDGLAR
ncbi:YgfZ/GcvT domain-containing protein [Lysobacter panacisoli]|uniref:Folate-binding protein YgfZ n=1 Tax=Lysobacter panacisoli TaxID=1255263 RepID=A0ABP9LCD0_9GAMM|nr:folate-binding protein [Lysobacter panacisoli]